MNISQNNSSSLSLVRPIGYGLLVVSLIYIADIFVPPRFTNPNWEFTAVGLMLERTPLPLVGLAMVFWGDAESRKKWEAPVLAAISWATLLVGLLYLLLIPLGISAASRLNTQSLTQLSTQYEQTISRLDEAQARLDAANPQQLNLLIDAFKKQDPNTELVTPDAVKTRINEDIAQSRKKAEATRQQVQSSQGLGLIKNSARSVVISLISSFLFVYAWRITAWARQVKLLGKKSNKKLT